MRPIKGWVGFRNGRLNTGRIGMYGDRNHLHRFYWVYMTKIEARKNCGDDIRRVTLIVDEPKKKAKR